MEDANVERVDITQEAGNEKETSIKVRKGKGKIDQFYEFFAFESFRVMIALVAPPWFFLINTLHKFQFHA
jgi:hypothetical protein